MCFLEQEGKFVGHHHSKGLQSFDNDTIVGSVNVTMELETQLQINCMGKKNTYIDCASNWTNEGEITYLARLKGSTL